MFKILFTSALPQELKAIKLSIKNQNILAKIDYISTGIGNYNTILNLTKYLVENTYDFVVNIGICGYTKDSKPFQVARIINLSNNKELLSPIHFSFLKLDSIACSEMIIYDEEEIGEENYVDMESYGFELVCDNFKVPRIILKVPYDKIGSKETTVFDKNKALEKLDQINYQKLIDEIVIFLQKYKKVKIDLSKYENHYKFSFAEKLIFEKLYNRYLSLRGSDFDIFFEKNKELSKNLLLEKLKQIV